MSRTSTAFSVRLPGDLRRQIDDCAESTGRSRNSIVVEAVAAHMEWQAAYIRAIDEAIAEADKGVFVSGEKITEWLQSWGTDNELPRPEPDIFPDRKG